MASGASTGDVLPMESLSEKDLQDHLHLLEVASEEDLDELLTDLLVHCYPSKAVQNS